MYNCHKCKYEITAECVPRSQKMGYPKCYQSVLTNYDRLISKTPEELAEYLSSICYDFWKMFVDDPKKMWLDWLKSPVEEEQT